MRVAILSILCCALFSFSQAQNKKVKKFPVSGTVTGTYSYCGGARPSDEMLADLATPKPLSNKKIYIKKGEVNSLDSKVLLVLTSDSKGNFHTKLAPGKYLVVDSIKKDMSYYNTVFKTYTVQTEHYEAIDTACFRNWFMTPNAVFEVTDKEVKNIAVNFHRICDDIPCARFRGPYKQ